MREDYANNSLRQMLEDKFSIHLSYAKQKVRAIPASKALAKDLIVEPNSPLLYIERVTYTDQEHPIEFLRIYHRGDRYTFFTELRD
jgi:GntR family transcriptional regulator